MNRFNTSIQDLSDYHIIEILVRLPVKTIIHCKCVCRDWLNLIIDSHFINLHLTKSPECFMLFDDDDYSMDPEPKPPSLRLLEIQEEHGHYHLHHVPIVSLYLNLAPIFQNTPPFVEGSVNGLICLTSDDKAYIGTFLNNHIHWNIRDYEDPHNNILTFDIDNETFKLFPSPPVGIWYQQLLAKASIDQSKCLPEYKVVSTPGKFDGWKNFDDVFFRETLDDTGVIVNPIGEMEDVAHSFCGHQ
ncbi:putative F-box protein At4g29970 [Rutidosis leptorrhynchoides]|uniref:putative F-box protein At4g29970 n=1 Tax=Rutidosis leptorrhynchoides TaxID=125765 RepID=UPI003A98E2B5